MRYQLGKHVFDHGDLAAAELHYRDSLSVQPIPWAWIGLGNVHESRADTAAAQEAYDRALALEKGHAVALFFSGRLALVQGDRGRARRLLERARATADDLHELESDQREKLRNAAAALLRQMDNP